MQEGTAMYLPYYRVGSASHLANSQSRVTIAHPLVPFMQTYHKYSRRLERFSAAIFPLKQEQQGKGPIEKACFTPIAVVSYHSLGSAPLTCPPQSLM